MIQIDSNANHCHLLQLYWDNSTNNPIIFQLIVLLLKVYSSKKKVILVNEQLGHMA
jgi:hypothetical protein